MSAARASVVAVDIGASGGKVLHALVGADQLGLREVARFPNGPITGGGSLRWDFDHLTRCVSDGISAAAAHAEGIDSNSIESTGIDSIGIDSIGIDTWGVDYGLLNSSGELMEQPYCYRDGRTTGMPERVAGLLTPAELYARTGTAPLPLQTIFQLKAAQDGLHLAGAAHALLMPDLLLHWLTGVRCWEVTNGSTSGLVDPGRREFDRELITMLGLSPTLLGDPTEPGTCIGPVLKRPGGGASAYAWEGVPVTAVASHDTASAVVAVPAADARFAFLSCGTWSILGVELAAPILSAESLAAGCSNELGVDGTVRYVRNMAGLWLLQECLRDWRDQGQPVEMQDVLQQAAQAASLRTLVDPDDPRFVPPGDMPTRLVAAAREAGDPVPRTMGEFARCIFDSLALAFRRNLRAMMGITGRDVDVVHIVGGGARNDLLCQLIADACRRPVVAGPVEASAIGNALVQARPLVMPGASLAELRRLVRGHVALRSYEPEGAEEPWMAAADRTAR